MGLLITRGTIQLVLQDLNIEENWLINSILSQKLLFSLCLIEAVELDFQMSFYRSISKKYQHCHINWNKCFYQTGSGIHLELTVRFIDAAQQFLPINVTQPFSLDLAAPSVLRSYSVQHFCPSPVPDYYILRYKKLEVSDTVLHVMCMWF